MTMESQVTIVEEISADKAPAIFGLNKLAAYVEAARLAVIDEVPDLTTRKGRERIASLAAQVARSKTAVEKPGRDYLKRIKELPRTIEAELREFVAAMDALRDEVRRPLTEWEEAEKARVANHQGELQAMRELANWSGMDAAGIDARITALEAVSIGEEWEEFEADAHRTKAATLSTLREGLAQRRQYEAEQAELERLRREAAEREQREREERIAREAAERAQREAEQRAQAEREAAQRREQELKEAAERADRERQDAERRAEDARRQAEQRAEQAAAAERQRLADEQARQEKEARRREADKTHKSAVLTAAKEALMVKGELTEAQAKTAINLIRTGQVPNVQITY